LDIFQNSLGFEIPRTLPHFAERAKRPRIWQPEARSFTLAVLPVKKFTKFVRIPNLARQTVVSNYFSPKTETEK
jgi:hypothetical protein